MIIIHNTNIYVEFIDNNYYPVQLWIQTPFPFRVVAILFVLSIEWYIKYEFAVSILKIRSDPNVLSIEWYINTNSPYQTKEISRPDAPPGGTYKCETNSSSIQNETDPLCGRGYDDETFYSYWYG